MKGIGGFTILDDKITDGEDAGVNFFLEEASIGRSRAEEAYKFVSELNPDVSGDCVVQVSIPWRREQDLIMVEPRTYNCE